jgi:hypothetical protein
MEFSPSIHKTKNILDYVHSNGWETNQEEGKNSRKWYEILLDTISAFQLNLVMHNEPILDSWRTKFQQSHISTRVTGPAVFLSISFISLSQTVLGSWNLQLYSWTRTNWSHLWIVHLSNNLFWWLSSSRTSPSAVHLLDTMVHEEERILSMQWDGWWTDSGPLLRIPIPIKHPLRLGR